MGAGFIAAGEAIAIGGGVIATGLGYGRLKEAEWRYDYASRHYGGMPARDWTAELQAQYDGYRRTTEWIQTGSEIVGWVGVGMPSAALAPLFSAMAAQGVAGQACLSTLFLTWGYGVMLDTLALSQGAPAMTGHEIARELARIWGPLAVSSARRPISNRERSGR